MHRIICAISLVVVTTVSGYSQESDEKNAPAPCIYSELYKTEGWKIPGLKGARKKSGRAAVPNKPGVYMTELEPTDRASTIEVFRCSQVHAGRLEVESIDIGIAYLYSFDVGGRVFAYSLTYGIDVAENGQSMPIGAVWLVMFYDPDGSGRFTLRRGEKGRFVPDLIPDWVKNNAETKTKPDENQAVPRN